MDLNFKDSIIRRRSDDYFSVTDMVKVCDKKLIKDFLRLKSTKEYIEALEDELDCSVIEVKVGGDHYGTWVHPRIATYLAQWISIKFSVKVSKWIEEWKEFNLKNDNKYIEEIQKLECSVSYKKEKEIQLLIKKELNVDIEVETPAGFIDVLTSYCIIEIKEISKWKHAVGQILSYGIFYPEKQKKIILFGEINDMKIIQKVCDEYDIEFQLY
jgi:KilA-N domain